MFESPASGASEKFFGPFSRAKRAKNFLGGGGGSTQFRGGGVVVRLGGVRGPVVLFFLQRQHHGAWYFAHSLYQGRRYRIPRSGSIEDNHALFGVYDSPDLLVHEREE